MKGKCPRVQLTRHAIYRRQPLEPSQGQERRIVGRTGTVRHPASGRRFPFPEFTESYYPPRPGGKTGQRLLSGIIALDEMDEGQRKRLEDALRDAVSEHLGRCSKELSKFRQVSGTPNTTGPKAFEAEFQGFVTGKAHEWGNWTQVRLRAKILESAGTQHAIQVTQMARVVRRHFSNLHAELKRILGARVT